MPTKTKINTRRLLLLARYLEKVPRRQFDMRDWGRGAIGKRYGKGCGFAGCAMGHATFIPSFRKAGLKLVTSQRLDEDFGINWNGATSGFYAAMHLFNIDMDQAEELFDSSDSRGSTRKHETPKQVAKRIRQFVKENR